MIATRFASIALATLLATSVANAQQQTSEGPDPAASAPVPGAEAPREDIVDATWAARIEYHRQLRSVDVSELSSAAASIALGAYSLSRDAPFTRGLGGMTLAGGGAHLISGIIYTIRSQRGMRPEHAPDAFREGYPYARELEEAEHHADVFIAVLTTDAGIITAGITTALAGVAREKRTVEGVGIALASQGVLTLLLDLMHQDQGRRYLRTLRNLSPSVSVLAAPDGRSTFVGSIAWSR